VHVPGQSIQNVKPEQDAFCSCNLDPSLLILIYESGLKIRKMYLLIKYELSRSMFATVRPIQTDRRTDRHCDRMHYHAAFAGDKIKISK